MSEYTDYNSEENEFISDSEINGIENDNIDINENELSDQLLSHYQENINDTWVIAPKTIDFNYDCYPLIYYQYDDVKGLENSNKIILPNKILSDLSVFRDIEYPMHFTINDSDVLFSPTDFKHDIGDVYIPQHFLENLGIEIGSKIKLTLINSKLEKGTKVKLKAHTSNFLEITDHKQYLEQNLVKLYSTLTKGQTILIPYLESTIFIDILECEPKQTISIIDTDLEVDFEAPWDYVKPPTPEIKNEDTNFRVGSFNFNRNRNNSKKDDKDKDKDKDNGGRFVPFSGVGRRLGNK